MKHRTIMVVVALAALAACQGEVEVPPASTVVDQAPTETVAPSFPADTASTAMAQLPPTDAVRRISLRDATESLNRGQAVLVDVREAESYRVGHAAGAIHIPEAEIVNRLSDLPIGKMVITYCT
jgi:3-mercaptopyruvate sulfurtransferase SseA